MCDNFSHSAPPPMEGTLKSKGRTEMKGKRILLLALSFALPSAARELQGEEGQWYCARGFVME
jgi:hypothetical protein